MSNAVRGFNDPCNRITFQAFLNGLQVHVNPMVNVAAAKFSHLYSIGNINQVFVTGEIKIMSLYDYFELIHIKKEKYVCMMDITKIKHIWFAWNDSIRAWQGGGELVTGDPKPEHNQPYLLQSLRSLIYLITKTSDVKTLVIDHILPIVKTLRNMYITDKDFQKKIILAINNNTDPYGFYDNYDATEPGELAILYYLKSNGKQLSLKAFTTVLYTALQQSIKISTSKPNIENNDHAKFISVYSIPIIQMLFSCVANNVQNDIIVANYVDLLEKQTELPDFVKSLCNDSNIPNIPSSEQFLSVITNELSISEIFPELFGPIDLNPFKLTKLTTFNKHGKEYKYPIMTSYYANHSKTCMTPDSKHVSIYGVQINPDNFESIKFTLEMQGIVNCTANQSGKILSIEEDDIIKQNMIGGNVKYNDGTTSTIISIESTSITVDMDKEFDENPITIVFDNRPHKFFQDFSISSGIAEISLFNKGILFTPGLTFILSKDNDKKCLRLTHNSDGKDINVCFPYQPLDIKFQGLGIVMEPLT